jgi:hypothetical protein
MRPKICAPQNAPQNFKGRAPKRVRCLCTVICDVLKFFPGHMFSGKVRPKSAGRKFPGTNFRASFRARWWGEVLVRKFPGTDFRAQICGHKFPGTDFRAQSFGARLRGRGFGARFWGEVLEQGFGMRTSIYGWRAAGGNQRSACDGRTGGSDFGVKFGPRFWAQGLASS